MTVGTKTEIIDWSGVEAPSAWPLPVWLDLLTSAERGERDKRMASAVRMGFVKVSRETLAQTAPAFPGYAARKPVKRRGKNAHRVGEAIDHGTAQTRAKLKADQVKSLYRRGTLDQVHVTAAERIAAVREALGRALTPGAALISDRVQGGGAFRDPLQRMGEREGRWWLNEYRPWLLDLVNDPIIRETKTKRQVFYCAVGFTMAVVVDNWCVQEAEEFCRLPTKKGIGQVLLRIALDRYALIAGLRSGEKTSGFAGLDEAA
ncbi:hypothetical protein [Parvibaculum sp.]|uniref:hypothetical protein n=1 Tax=Parvibaculum sp. TaxID=2024848 RepID=UPI00391D36D0